MVPPSDMFDDAVLAVAGDDRPALVRAEQAACLSGIGRAIYDALLERIVVEHDGRKDPARHRLHLDGMVREIGRAHVCTPVTNEHIVCRLLLEKKKNTQTNHQKY